MVLVLEGVFLTVQKQNNPKKQNQSKPNPKPYTDMREYGKIWSSGNDRMTTSLQHTMEYMKEN